MKTATLYHQRSIAVARPDLIERLVNKQDCARIVDPGTEVIIWCDGRVSRQRPHPRHEYSVKLGWLIAGENRCPSCARMPREARRLTTYPRIMSRLLDRSDRFLHANSSQTVRVVCNGAVRSKVPHALISYEATADQLTATSKDPCPLCPQRKSSR